MTPLRGTVSESDSVSKPILIPGGRDVRAVLDLADEEPGDGTPADATDTRSAAEDSVTHDESVDACVVSCPPHPHHQGHRGDRRLTAVSDTLSPYGIDCLRVGYGTWDNGYGESADIDAAVRWAVERYDRVGLFGYSFGGWVALVTATSRPELAGTSVLAPTAEVNPDRDIVNSLDTIEGPVQAIYGSQDTTANWQSIIEQARKLSHDVVELSANHSFVGYESVVADRVGEFFMRALTE